MVEGLPGKPKFKPQHSKVIKETSSPPQDDLIIGRWEWLSIHNSVTAVWHIDEMRNRNHMMISIAMEMTSDKGQLSLLTKSTVKIRKKQPQGSKVYISQIYSQHYMNEEKLYVFSLKSRIQNVFFHNHHSVKP